jgi:hypothetical protein
MKISTQKGKGILVLIGVLFLLPPLTVFAQGDMIMVPVAVNKPLKNIITVAKANGKFTDPVAAVKSITDVSPSNPYLVVIGPGVYTITETLQMRGWVDIVGSGERTTVITGAISTTSKRSSAIIRGTNFSTLSSLTVENKGGSSTYSVALYNESPSPTVSNVTAKVSGGIYNYGVINDNSDPTMNNVTVWAFGGTYSYGVDNINGSFPTMNNVTATASGGTYSYGVHSSSSIPTMINVTATASGGTYNHGVYNSSSSSTMINVTAAASGGAYNYGVYNNALHPNSLYPPTMMTGVIAKAAAGTDSYGVFNTDSANPKIRRSTMDGQSLGLYTAQASTSMVSQSTIIGGAGGPGTNQCVACDNGTGTALNATCN